MKRTLPKRDWQDAREQKIDEHVCRVCGAYSVEAAHTVGREHDEPCLGSYDLYVNPDSVVPLCRLHHREYDAHALDILSLLDLPEQLDAVLRAGGIENARIRLCPSAYKAAA